MDWTPIIIALIAGLFGGGGLVAYFKARSEIRVNDATADKTQADTTEVIGKAWAQLFVQMQGQISDLKKEVEALRQEQAAKDERIQTLEDEVEARDTRIATLEQKVIRLTAELAKFRVTGG